MNILSDVALAYPTRIHPAVQQFIDLHSTCQLLEDDAEVFTHATNLLADSQEFHAIQRKKKLIFICSEGGPISLGFGDQEIAAYAGYSFINLTELRKHIYQAQVAIVLEMTVRHFWDAEHAEQIVCYMMPYVIFDPAVGKYIFNRHQET